MQKIMRTALYTLFLFSIMSCTDNKNDQNLEVEKINYLKTTQSFDITTSNVGIGFEGHSIEGVGKFLAAKSYILEPPVKGEYETTKDYQERLNNFDPKKELFNTTDTEFYMAFPIENIPIKGLSSFKYNADEKELEINIGITGFSNSNLEVNNISNAREFSTRNTFGRTVTVKYTDEVKYSLSLYKVRKSYLNPKWLFHDPIRNLYSEENLSFTRAVKLSAEKARELKWSLKILIIAKPDSPYLEQHKSTFTPTDDYLWAGERVKNEIIAKIEQIWLYDSSTGDVIKKWPDTI